MTDVGRRGCWIVQSTPDVPLLDGRGPPLPHFIDVHPRPASSAFDERDSADRHCFSPPGAWGEPFFQTRAVGSSPPAIAPLARIRDQQTAHHAVRRTDNPRRGLIQLPSL